MNTNDKNYVDRLHNQQVNELNEIKNRLLILEGKTTAATDGNLRVEIDTNKIYEMFLKACHDCLQQRQERIRKKTANPKTDSDRNAKPKENATFPTFMNGVPLSPVTTMPSSKRCSA